MKKISLVPGKKYKGYAVLNEYGEINFTPAQVGSKPDQKKIVVEREDFTIYETKNLIISSIRLPRELSFMQRISTLLQIIDKLLIEFKKYDF